MVKKRNLNNAERQTGLQNLGTGQNNPYYNEIRTIFKNMPKHYKPLENALHDWDQVLPNSDNEPQEETQAKQDVLNTLNSRIQSTLEVNFKHNIDSVEKLKNNTPAIRQALQQKANEEMKMRRFGKKLCFGTLLLSTVIGLAKGLLAGGLGSIPGMALGGLIGATAGAVFGLFSIGVVSCFVKESKYEEAQALVDTNNANNANNDHIGNITSLIERMSHRVQPQPENRQQPDDRLNGERKDASLIKKNPLDNEPDINNPSFGINNDQL